MAFLKAGELTLDVQRSDDRYELEGHFQTSKAMSVYYTWNGVFAARGRWQATGPVTEAYLARTSSKDDELKIVVHTEQGVRLLDDPDGEFETIDKPAGSDLISALFLSPACSLDGVVHDGEDAYHLHLREQGTRHMDAGDGYFSGEVVDCDYTVLDYKSRKRRVIVSLGQVGNTVMAVQVRAKIPILPDPIFRLRTPLGRDLSDDI